MGDLWSRAGRLLKQKARIKVHWMPSHKTIEELQELGLSRQQYEGNGRADNMAKQVVATLAPSPELVVERTQQREDEMRVAKVMVRIQKEVLSARPRTRAGVAAKSRKRKEPMIPRALRARKQVKKPKTRPQDAQRVDADMYRTKRNRAGISAPAAAVMLPMLCPRESGRAYT